ncbi:MAG: PHP domain-containing protein [Dehalococcoidales bacterium]|nr:PHP domain-containing protein [Dehalococcoidales bacterium]
MLIDLHTHTFPKSDDSLLYPEELIAQAKKTGLDGICITDHDWYWTEGAIAHLSKEHDFLLIPGVEVNTEEGHVIAFGIDEFKFGMHRVSFIREMLDNNGGFMILAHPFRHTFYIDDDINETIDECYQKPLYQLVDTIEVLNGKGKTQQNKFSQELARRLGCKGTGGSDAHETKDMPSCATYFERNIRNREELIQELKAGRYRAVDLRKH